MRGKRQNKGQPPRRATDKSGDRDFPPRLEDLYPHLWPGGFTLRDEANAIVAEAFRNGPLEDLHAGKHSPLLEDESLSRITDEEMKTLIINACRKVEELLRLKESNPAEYELH